MQDQTLPLCYTLYIWVVSFAFNFYTTKKGDQDFFSIKLNVYYKIIMI